MTSPLAGIRVLEFGNLIAAPYAGMLLADLGADVIKIEPLSGDLGRGFGPFLAGESVFFLAVNRGKRSLAIDPKHPEAKPWLDRLVEGADVVLDNLRSGAMARMGYDPPGLERLNPRLVQAVVSAFGSAGPYADRAGIDVIFQAESGMISVTGHPGDPPQKTATTIGDYVAATNVALAITAALFDRERTGRGSRVEVSLRDGLLAVQSGWWALYFSTGGQPPRTGTASPFLAPNQVFAAADGHFALAIVSDRHFRVMCETLGRADLAERYPTNADRMESRQALADTLAAIFAAEPAAHWVERLSSAGLPVGRLLDFDGVVADPQIAHNEMIVEYAHPRAGRTRAIGSPLRVDGSPARAEPAPPLLGEHSRQILTEAGADPPTVERLVATGAVVVS